MAEIVPEEGRVAVILLNKDGHVVEAVTADKKDMESVFLCNRRDSDPTDTRAYASEKVLNRCGTTIAYVFKEKVE